jgi:hypothetical protein
MGYNKKKNYETFYSEEGCRQLLGNVGTLLNLKDDQTAGKKESIPLSKFIRVFD